jgi:Domain of unknown function (DUF5069)
MASPYWDTTFLSLFRRCEQSYRSGQTHFSTWFNSGDTDFLNSIGCGQQEFFDFVDDHCRYPDGPSEETALLVAGVRRDYLWVVQKGIPSTKTVAPSDLPAKSAAISGIPWLPRLIAKARAKLRGEMDSDTMYGCGGDRAFFAQHRVHPADLLRVVWAAGDDDQKIIDFVRSGSPGQTGR